MNEKIPKSEIGPELKILDISPKDAKGYRELEYETWKATYVNESTRITEGDINWFFNKYKHAFTEGAIGRFAVELEDMPEGHKAVVVKDNEKIVGVAWLMRNPEQNEIGSIYIRPEYQSRGIGKKIWQVAQEFFDQNVKTVITVNKENERAIEYYESLGFRKESDIESKLIFPSGAKFEEIRMVRPPNGG